MGTSVIVSTIKIKFKNFCVFFFQTATKMLGNKCLLSSLTLPSKWNFGVFLLA